MKVCYRAGKVTRCDNYFAIDTDGAPIRLWFLTDDILRIRAGFDGDWDENSYSLVMTAWPSRTDALLGTERRRVETAEAELEDGDKEAVIRGKHLTVTVHRDPFHISVHDREGTLIHEDIPDLAYREDMNRRRMHTIRIEAEDHFYGFGEKAGEIDKAQCFMSMAPGDAMGYDPEKTDSLYKHIPFFIRLQGETKKATGYFYHNTSECSFNMGREKRNYWHRYATYTADAGDIDLFLIAGPSIRDIVRRYTDLTGKSALLPRAALGYLGSSMYYPELPRDCDDAILEFIDTTREEGIPVDGFQLSSGYCAVETPEGIKRCTFTWNHARFKDPAGWFTEMKKRGIVVSPNIKPGMLLVHPLLKDMMEKNMFIKADPELKENSPGSYQGCGVGTWWGGRGVFVDFTDPAVREHWKGYIKDALLKYGCTSIWNDNCEYDSMVDKDAVVCGEGKESTIGETKAVMSNLMCKLSDDAIMEYFGNVRPYTVCRSGHAGIQRYAQVWAGDNLTCWETLKYNIATILGMGLSGVANHGCDVGGFFGPAPEEELFVRWVQSGIFFPRMSIHSTNTDNTVTEPWMYSKSKEHIRAAIEWRYRMSPYLYSLEWRAHETGLPIMEALCSAFQHDPATYREGVDFMWGDSILAANVVEKGQTVRPVYLPRLKTERERWYDLKTREAFEPGRTVNVPVSLSDIPMFVRSGAIVPMSLTPLKNLMTEQVRDLKILLVPDVDSSFTLYEDDGVSNDYLSGKYLKTKISVTAGEQTLIRFEHSGDHPTAVEKIHLDVLHREKAPFYVLLDGETLPHYLHRKKYEAADRGWYYSQTLKSVQIKYRNPKHDHEVTVSFAVFDLIGM
ncbi:MAG: DUF4968 domain-containing protein [Clostridia bacterium]|nr:DUF4968 domain-containing protein [Clostridia bacterium]